MVPTLRVLEGPEQGQTYQTLSEPVVIGRCSGQLLLSDDNASRRHAEVRPANGTWILVDLDSANGTFLNGRRVVTPTVLENGDQIRIGGTVLVFGAEDRVGGSTAAELIGRPAEPAPADPPEQAAILAAVNASEASATLQPAETADAVAAWNVVYRIVEAIGAMSSVKGFLECVADIVFDHLVVDRLVLLTYGPDRRNLTPLIVRRRADLAGAHPGVVTSQRIMRHVVDTREGVLCANAMSDTRFGGESNHDSVYRFGLRSIICVPIAAPDGVHGVFHLDCSTARHTYTPEQLRVAVAIGRLTGMVMENARLLETRMRTERLAAIGETAAYLSHHIRNILQGLQGGADVVELALKRKDFETTQSGWTLVRHNLDRIYQLTMNMLTFSKKRQPRIETAQLNRIVDDVISLVRNRADARSVTIRSELAEIPPIPLDPDGVHQVVHNLILNAIDAVPEDSGRIRVITRLEPTERRVILSISDNGPGIPPEAIDTVFVAFQSSKGQGGTGLGLAAAKKIIEELNGAIEVDSTIDEGTTFHVVLPMKNPCPAQDNDMQRPD